MILAISVLAFLFALVALLTLPLWFCAIPEQEDEHGR
jgi:hypothetical protein